VTEVAVVGSGDSGQKRQTFSEEWLQNTKKTRMKFRSEPRRNPARLLGHYESERGITSQISLDLKTNFPAYHSVMTHIASPPNARTTSRFDAGKFFPLILADESCCAVWPAWAQPCQCFCYCGGFVRFKTTLNRRAPAAAPDLLNGFTRNAKQMLPTDAARNGPRLADSKAGSLLLVCA